MSGEIWPQISLISRASLKAGHSHLCGVPGMIWEGNLESLEHFCETPSHISTSLLGPGGTQGGEDPYWHLRTLQVCPHC